MTHRILVVLGLLLIFCVQINAEITLKNSLFGGWKYSTDGWNYNKVGNSGKALRWEMEGNWLAQWHMDKYRTQKSWELISSIPGGFLIGWPVGEAVAGGEWKDYHTTMVIIGAPLALFSVIMGSAANRNLKKAVRIFNGAPQKSNSEYFPAEISPQIRFTVNF